MSRTASQPAAVSIMPVFAATPTSIPVPVGIQSSASESLPPSTTVTPAFAPTSTSTTLVFFAADRPAATPAQEPVPSGAA